MTKRPRSDFLDVMVTRGYLQDCTDMAGLDERLMAAVVPAYVGYDATAQSLHAGHLMIIMMLRWLQKTGHRPITLMGGGTTKVGDPSFRSDERPLLSPEQIATNIATIRGVFFKYLDYGDGQTGALMLDNAEWLDDLNYLTFLRDIGRHFSVNRMLSFDSVRSRLDREQPLSFLEFNYMILQAYDFLELYRRHGCLLQMGGSDQWGNIVNGIDLTRRVAGAQVFGLVSPLLTTSHGAKMGKTAGGAVWLNDERSGGTEIFDFWQFWRNVADADVGRFLKLYTELPVAECERLGALGGTEINDAKVTLASNVTELCHGRKAAEMAEATAKGLFRRIDVEDTAVIQVLETASVLRVVTLTPADVPVGGIPVVQLLVRAGLAASGKDARRLIAEGGARLDDVALTDAGLHLKSDALAATLKLSAGRKRHALVRLEG